MFKIEYEDCTKSMHDAGSISSDEKFPTASITAMTVVFWVLPTCYGVPGTCFIDINV
jgi:hypothetical protein